VERRKTTRASITSGTATTAVRWLALKIIGRMSMRASNGVVNVPEPAPSNSSGMTIESPARTWARAMVATARMSRGALRKRRMMVASTTAPNTAAMARPARTARKKFQFQWTTNTMARTAATLPNSAWAKFTTRLAR
jgi:hypothetical protein